MKQRYIIALALFAGLLSSCTVQDIPMPGNDGLFTFHAESGEAPETKTVLQSGTLVHWCPQDEIHVFYGNTSGRFVSTNTSVSATADFKGELPGLQRNDNDAFWAVYPYAQEQSFDGNTVTLSLPATQTAVEGTFADDLFLSMARSTSTDLRFYNVCGGIKFSVGIGGVKKIVFRGKNNEPLAGKVKVGFDNNLPKVSAILDAERTITVNAPDGGTFSPGAWYYLVSLPASLTQGYVMELYGESLLDSKEGNSSVDIVRSVWGVLSEVGGDSPAEDFTGLCIEAIEDGTISIANPLGLSIEYSKDARIWTSSNANPIEIAYSAGDIICLRGNNEAYATNEAYTNIQFSSDCYVSGNIMSLISSKGYESERTLTGAYTFYQLFYNNTHLLIHSTKGITLPATTLANLSYCNMFAGCTGLTIAPKLPATNLARSCYFGLFKGTGLIAAPELPAITLAPFCYAEMFLNCISLTDAPELPATTLVNNCYDHMFWGCRGLTTAPALPATILAASCYNSMFVDCTSLIKAPDLPATNLTTRCYEGMFLGCSSLNYIKASFTTSPGPDYTEDWVRGVAFSGTFVKNPEATWDVRGENGIPEGWIVDDGTEDFTGLSIEAIENGEIEITNHLQLTIEYSKDGKTWTASNANPIVIPVSVGDVVRFRGDNPTYYKSYKFTRFIVASRCYIYGNIMSLVDSKKYDTLFELKEANTFRFLFYWSQLYNHPTKELRLPATTLSENCYTSMFAESNNLTRAPSLPATSLAKGCYYEMFLHCTSLTSAPELPATVLADNCYEGMFGSCISLTSAPELPATVLANNCYKGMFVNCLSLTSAPELPATVLADNCYEGMFRECLSLTSVPELPATALAASCYSFMFFKCTSLTVAPELPATTLAGGCYSEMFSNCTNLVNAPELPATTLAGVCYSGMFSNCTNLVNAPELPATSLTVCCYENMFSNCTSLVNAPELPATTLAERCYIIMFSNCTSLVNAPELPATTLALCCYESMFSNCTNLVNAPELPATTLAGGCYSEMFSNCTSLVNAPELPATTLASGCYSEMFSNCTSLVNAPELPATTLPPSCYESMFSNCTSLIAAPVLPATILDDFCYRYMFQGCSSLNYIKAMFINAPWWWATTKWVEGVTTTGTFVKSPEATWNNEFGDDAIPNGWAVVLAE